jgi:ankyrin repeat protein
MLEKACIENQDDKVIKYLTGTRPVQIDVRNRESETCLMIACKNRSSSVVDVILGIDHKLESRDALGKTALWHAVESGSVEIVEKMIDAGADYFAPLADGWTNILHLAAQNGHVQVIKLIIQRSIQTNEELKIKKWAASMNAEHETVHHIAAKNGYTEIIDFLADFGVHVNQPTFDNVNRAIYPDEPSPLHHAISNGHIETVRCLAKHGAQVNAISSYYTELDPPLRLACKKGCLEMIKILLEAKADPNLFGWDLGMKTTCVRHLTNIFITK